MDEDLRRFIESTSAETRRHFDVVSERLESKIDNERDSARSRTAAKWSRVTMSRTPVAAVPAYDRFDCEIVG